MHEIETLLESSIDKNFDLFELYCLNNIFNMSKNENYDNRFYQVKLFYIIFKFINLFFSSIWKMNLALLNKLTILKRNWKKFPRN